ncbi:MAG: hypothetical protein CL878_03310 [Dehalococcoidia bacterium]|nr:hypothetical protein [Dehalococcoidia bacterium]
MQLCYRSRQWWRSLGAELPAPDRAFVQAHLSQLQRTLFAAMLPRDQVHAFAVYRAILRDHPDIAANPDIAVAALLHDAGKVGTQLWHRVAYVLLQDFAPGVLRRLGPVIPHDVRYPFYALREHAGLGAALARAAGCNDRVVTAIAQHHNPAAAQGSDDVLVRALQAADARE